MTRGMVITALLLGISMTGLAHAELPDEVRIGILSPLTGELSSFGIQLNYAAELAVSDFNEYLAENDVEWRLVAVTEDTETNPVRALEKTQALHSRGIDVIVGPAGSAQLSSMLTYLNDNNMVAISPSSTAPSLAIPDDAVFRTVPNDLNQGKALAAMLDYNGIEALVPIWRNEVYGQGLVNAVAENFESRGGTVYEGINYHPESGEFSVGVGQLADTVSDVVETHGADKTAVLVIAFDEVVPIFQAAASYDVLGDVQWFGSESVAQSTEISSDPIASQFAMDATLVTAQLLLDLGERSESVSVRMNEWLGAEPTTFVYTAYDAVWLAGLGIMAADSTDASDVRAVIRDVADSYSGGALSSAKLNEAGDLMLSNYETWNLGQNGWVRGVTYEGQSDSIKVVTGDILVGSLLPLTGGYSSVGVQVDAATQLAVDDFNAYLAEKGAQWQMVLLREDSASNPVVALEKMQSLHSRGADIVFGPAGSARVSSVMAYVNTNNMILLSCCSTSPALSIPGDRVFRTVADDFNQGLAFGKILEERGIQAVVPLWIGDTYGDGLRNAAVENFESRGGVYDEGIRYNPDTVEFSVTVASLADRVQEMADAHGAENVGVIVVAFDEIVPILQAATSYDILGQVEWFGSESVAQSTAIAADPLALQFSADVGFTAVQLLLSTGEKAEYVRDSLAEQLGDSPDAFVYTGYDAVWLAGLSAEAAGSADPADIAAVLPSVAADYTSGALKTTTLNENGDLAIANYEIWAISDNGWSKQAVFDIGRDMITPAGTIMVDGTEFAPVFDVQGATITSMHTDPSESTLVVNMISDAPGTLQIVLDRDLIDSSENDVDSKFFVLVDDEEADYLELDTGDDSRTISVDFRAGAERIEIIGTSAAVPEFGQIAMLVLAVGLVTMTIATYKYRMGPAFLRNQ